MSQQNSSNAAKPLQPSGRIHSIDQFRGYTVLGMFVVNYLGHYPAPYNFHHNDYFLSYADTIMPAFMFVVGISFRFTLLKRLAASSVLKTYAGYARRSLLLCLISITLNAIGMDFWENKDFFTNPQTDAIAQAEWEQFESGELSLLAAPHFADRIWSAFRLFVKSSLWQTLAVIGLAQLLILPFAHLKFWNRLTVMAILGVGHAVLTGWFNWQFFYGYTLDGQYVDAAVGLNNWMGQLWETGSNRGWDGGVFGVLLWGFMMLAGTLCYDLMSVENVQHRVKNLIKWGTAFVLSGYFMSCVQTLYDVPDTAQSPERFVPAATDTRITNTNGTDRRGVPYHLAESPVVPDWAATQHRPLTSFLAEPPFVARPENRLINYWMLAKRFVSLPFAIVASGLAFLGLAVFVVTADILKIQIGVFRTFGMNALAAYILHQFVLHLAVFPNIPKDSAAIVYWTGLGVFLAFVYAIVYWMERRGIYIKM